MIDSRQEQLLLDVDLVLQSANGKIEITSNTRCVLFHFSDWNTFFDFYDLYNSLNLPNNILEKLPELSIKVKHTSVLMVSKGSYKISSLGGVVSLIFQYLKNRIF